MDSIKLSPAVLDLTTKKVKKRICKMYKQGKSMRLLALEFETTHKRISRILKGKDIPTQFKEKSYDASYKIQRIYIYMAGRLRFDVDYAWFMRFSNPKKVQLLNACISQRGNRWIVDTKWYKSYITKFYNDEQFNRLYNTWVSSNYESYKKPSIDHITPKSKGGTENLDNLQFLSWFENRSKNDMTQDEWNNIKLNIKDYIVI